ncbi:hypothetical protein SMSP1_01935 [Sedimentisphaera salicampi]|nr:hypothetical protein SMSP1_01935 [Sedimentisphaera salicampi]
MHIRDLYGCIFIPSLLFFPDFGVNSHKFLVAAAAYKGFGVTALFKLGLLEFGKIFETGNLFFCEGSANMTYYTLWRQNKKRPEGISSRRAL